MPLPPTAKKTRLLAVPEIALNAPLRPVERFPQVGPPEPIASVKMTRLLRSSVRVSARPSPSFSAWWVLPIGPGLVYNGSSMNLAGARVGVVVLLLSGLALEGRARAQAENGRQRAEIQRLVVRSDRRGLGVGRMLMEAAIGEAHRLDLRLLWLMTHEGSDADRVYERLGWTRLGAVPAYSTLPDGSLTANAYYYLELA